MAECAVQYCLILLPMPRPTWLFCLFATLSIAVIGCGGSGGTTTSVDTIAGNERQLGALSIISKGPAPAIVSGATNGSGISVTSLAGTNFTSVRLTPAKDMANTRLAFWVANRIAICDPNGNHVEAIPMPAMNFPHGTIAFSPDGSRIAFSAVPFGTTVPTRSQIYEVNLDGSNFKQLTNGLATDADPSWSSNNFIAYSQIDSDTYCHIYVMNGDGSSPKRITNGSFVDVMPNISRDGSKVVFVEGLHSSINIVDTAGTNRRVLVPGNQFTYRSASFSPDATTIAYALNDDTADDLISETPISKWDPAPLIGQGKLLELPTYSADGRMLAYSYGDSIVNDVRIWDFATNSGHHVVDGNLGGWSSFPGPRQILGTGGVLGAGAGALLVAQNAHDILSTVAVDAVTRTSLQSTVESSGDAQVFRISGGGGIKTVYYMNGSRGQRLTLTAGSTNFVGVLVSISSETGFVSNLIPYNKMSRIGSGKATAFAGDFLGVFDATGKRTAGSGTSLHFDSKGNAILR